MNKRLIVYLHLWAPIKLWSLHYFFIPHRNSVLDKMLWQPNSWIKVLRYQSKEHSCTLLFV